MQDETCGSCYYCTYDMLNNNYYCSLTDQEVDLFDESCEGFAYP